MQYCNEIWSKANEINMLPFEKYLAVKSLRQNMMFIIGSHYMFQSFMYFQPNRNIILVVILQITKFHICPTENEIRSPKS